MGGGDGAVAGKSVVVGEKRESKVLMAVIRGWEVDIYPNSAGVSGGL